MTNTVKMHQYLYIAGLPLALVIIVVAFSRSSFFHLHPGALSLGITLDLLLSLPFVYYLLIRKTDIPNYTMLPVFVAGVVIAGIILPGDQQFLLSKIKYWVLPFVEIVLLFIVATKVSKTIKLYKKQKNLTPDFYTALLNATGKVLPSKIAPAFATEIGLFYYGFLSWKRRELNENDFFYHQKSGTITLLSVFIFIILMETSLLHFLLQLWNNTAAWIFSALSLYTVLQVYGITRSLGKRPIRLESDQLILRYGMFCETTIPFHKIHNIELSSRTLKNGKLIQQLSPLKNLEKHNIIIELKKENTIYFMYGMKKTYKTIAFHVDEKERFVHSLKEKNKSLIT